MKNQKINTTLLSEQAAEAFSVKSVLINDTSFRLAYKHQAVEADLTQFLNGKSVAKGFSFKLLPDGNETVVVLKYSEEVKYATKRLIDSVWTVSYKMNPDGTVHIISYDRENIIGYTKEKELPRCTFVETPERLVTHLIIQEYEHFRSWPDQSKPHEQFHVGNPKYIFSYEEK